MNEEQKEKKKRLRGLVSQIRKEWMSWNKKFQCLQKNAERVELPDGRYKTLIRCQSCLHLHDRKNIQVHHQQPVGKLLSDSEEDIKAYRQRMFCHPSLLEPQCIDCHRQTTRNQINK